MHLHLSASKKGASKRGASNNIYKKYLIKGIYKIIGVDKIQITELPIGTWTSKYREFLDEIIIENDTKEKEKPKNKKGFINGKKFILDVDKMGYDKFTNLIKNERN